MTEFGDRVIQRLTEAAETYEDRNAEYKDNFRAVGRVMTALFPEGRPPLVTEQDYNRWHIFELIIVKLTRYAANYDNPKNGDSLLDKMPYIAILSVLDEEMVTGSVADDRDGVVLPGSGHPWISDDLLQALREISGDSDQKLTTEEAMMAFQSVGSEVIPGEYPNARVQEISNVRVVVLHGDPADEEYERREFHSGDLVTLSHRNDDGEEFEIVEFIPTTDNAIVRRIGQEGVAQVRVQLLEEPDPNNIDIEPEEVEVSTKKIDQV